MLSKSFKTLLLIAGAVFIGTFPVQAEDTLSKSDIEKIVKDYLLENGEIIIEAVDAYQQKAEKERQAKTTETIKAKLDLLTSADAPSAGNPKGDVTVIEFFDYNCGYCKRALPDINTLIEKDKNVRFVFREMPILGPTSRTAAQWALAAHKQGKYFEYHSALMKFRGQKSDAQLAKLAKNVGLDVEKARKDAASDAIEEQLNKDIELARLVGVEGTPAFIVDGEFFPGYLGEGGLKKAIEKAREK